MHFTCLWSQEKARLKKERDEAEAEYKVAYIDGKPEPVCFSDSPSLSLSHGFDRGLTDNYADNRYSHPTVFLTARATSSLCNAQGQEHPQG